MLARQIVMGFGIAAIIPWLIYFGLSTFYPPPRHQDYFQYQMPPPATATPEERKAYAAEQVSKRQVFEAAAKAFARVLFAISTVVGVAAILLGAYLRPHSVGAGVMLGGISSLALGYWGYAQYLDDWLRFVSLLAGFLALLFIGFRKLERA